jgi:hypothetical protein
MTFKEKQAYAKTLGINTFQKNGDALDALIAEAEAAGAAPVNEGDTEKKYAPETPKTEKPKDPPAPTLNNSDAIALYAAQMAKEAMEKLGKMEQAAKGKKSGKSDADIEKAGKDDAAIIAHMEKVEILIPWYPNAPREFTSCVNGYVCVIPVGKKKRVPLACYEDFMQQLKKKQKNADKFAAAEKKFLNS